MSKNLGTTTTYVIFLILLASGLMITALDGFTFILALGVFAATNYYLIPFLANPQIYYTLCSKVPFISGSIVCKYKEIKIDAPTYVTVPVKGGISVRFGSKETGWRPPGTLYAGEPYEFPFTIVNEYEGDVSFQVRPGILSEYGNGVEFIQPFQQKTSSLGVGGFYADSVYLDPNQMTIEAKYGCPYTLDQLSYYNPDVECAYEVPCEAGKVCVRTGTFECKCVDWTDVTCSKSPLRAELHIVHSGFFKGKARLYYSENITSPKPAYSLVQGPLKVTVEFQPNPYIAKIHKYRQDVSMFVTFRNTGSGNITISNFNVVPLNTIIHTYDKRKGVELIEEVGSKVISCRSLNEILPGGFLPEGKEVGGKLCTLTPPLVRTTLKFLNFTNETSEVNYNQISYYCEQKAPECKPYQYYSTSSSKCECRDEACNRVCEDVGAGSGTCGKDASHPYQYEDDCYCEEPVEKKLGDWKNIFENVGNTGLCQIIKGEEKKEEKKTVESSLAYVDVLIQFSYSRSATYFSKPIYPYTRTEECIARAGLIK